MTDKIIRVGAGIIIINPKGQILAGKRSSKHREGTWALVGGWQEFGESFEDCARREVLEETGLELTDIRTLQATNYIFKDEGRHSVTIYMIGCATGEPKVMEPDKCLEWRWFNSLADIPHPTFVPYVDDVDPQMIENYKKEISAL
jgi:8-oxo-dGTP diphosphatase